MLCAPRKLPIFPCHQRRRQWLDSLPEDGRQVGSECIGRMELTGIDRSARWSPMFEWEADE
jgi:hypothetical protein